jgi:hypothetical protein
MSQEIAWQYMFRVPKKKIQPFFDALKHTNEYCYTTVLVDDVFRNWRTYDVLVTCFRGNHLAAMDRLKEASA